METLKASALTTTRQPSSSSICSAACWNLPQACVRNNPQAEQTIAQTIQAWRDAGALIVHRHISRTPGSPFSPGQPGVEFQPQFQPSDTEHVVEKNVPDAFIHSGLVRWLRVRGIAAVAIVGVSTNNSVEAPRAPPAISVSKPMWPPMPPLPLPKPTTTESCAAPRTSMRCHWNLHGEYATVVTAGELRSAL